jgi:hypothetical protein
MSEITLESFRCVLQQLLRPLLLGGASLGQVPPVADVGAQPADLFRGHEAARQRAPLGDLRQPDGVQLVFSELEKDLGIGCVPACSARSGVVAVSGWVGAGAAGGVGEGGDAELDGLVAASDDLVHLGEFGVGAGEADL